MNVEFSQINQLVDQYVDEYINLNELNERLNYGTNNFIITMIKQDLLNTVIVLINQMKITDFKIIGNEVEVKRDYSNFKFSGIVDRVDQYDNYLKIID